MTEPKTFKALVEEVHSGDDFILMVDLGVDGLHKRVRARLHGVDAPNAYKAAANTDAGRVRDEVSRIAGPGREVTVRVIVEGRGGGWIVELFVTVQGKTTNLNQLLRERGYVYVKTGQDTK